VAVSVLSLHLPLTSRGPALTREAVFVLGSEADTGWLHVAVNHVPPGAVGSIPTWPTVNNGIHGADPRQRVGLLNGRRIAALAAPRTGRVARRGTWPAPYAMGWDVRDGSRTGGACLRGREEDRLDGVPAHNHEVFCLGGTMPLVQLYPTDNPCPRWCEIVELYRLNRRWMPRVSALWHSMRRRAYMPGGLPPMRLIDNLGLVVNVLRMDERKPLTPSPGSAILDAVPIEERSGNRSEP
jgi:hypothetical protein